MSLPLPERKHIQRIVGISDALGRAFFFNRRPGDRNNRGRIPTAPGVAGPPPVDDILTIGGDPLTDSAVELKNG